MWSYELQLLSNIALTQPQAVHSAYIHGILNMWTYLWRTYSNVNNCQQSLEHLIGLCLISSLTGRDAVNDIERELLSCYGGMGLIDPSSKSFAHVNASIACYCSFSWFYHTTISLFAFKSQRWTISHEINN